MRYDYTRLKEFSETAAKELGYNYEIWVYNSKGVKVECYK